VDKNDSAVCRATAIFDEHGEFIRIVLRHQAGSGLDVEDLYQEFYLALIRKPVPADVRDMRGYLYRAVVHHVINAARLRETYSHTMKKYAKETEISINTQGMENAFITDEHQSAAIARLARCLQEREAEAFVMKYRDECSILEIATRMGINKRTVSRYLSESLRKLQRRLAPE
jgi:RNA polymerase sigma factor (sigma-70 family)